MADETTRPKRASRWGLQNYEDVRRQLASAIRKVQQSKMDPKIGTALANMYRALMESMDRKDNGQRIDELERMLADMRAQYERDRSREGVEP